MAGFYLAGGTAIALHLGHRISRDLDFFSLSPDTELEAAKAAVRAAFDEAQTVRQTDAAVQLLCDGTPIDLVRYPYPLLQPPPRDAPGIAVAGLLDLATMKLSAIARRGLRRDFWDLEVIATRGAVSLREASEAYVLRFGVAEADLYHVYRALTYFEDAERDPVLPEGLTAPVWEDLKAFFRREAPRLLRAAGSRE
jgi:hypothetical protein